MQVGDLVLVTQSYWPFNVGDKYRIKDIRDYDDLLALDIQEHSYPVVIPKSYCELAYEPLPVPTSKDYYVLKVVKDIPKGLHGFTRLPFIPKGTITWSYNADNSHNYHPEGNRFGANVPKEYFEIVKTVKSMKQIHAIPVKSLVSYEGVNYTVVGYANDGNQVYITNSKSKDFPNSVWILNDEYDKPIHLDKKWDLENPIKESPQLPDWFEKDLMDPVCESKSSKPKEAKQFIQDVYSVQGLSKRKVIR
jgi:hypothetical protein